MPVLSFAFDYASRPVIELYVSMSSAEVQECLDEGRTIPVSIPIRALVDTGAGRSHVDLDVMSRLAISPISDDLIYTASGQGAIPRDIYLVDLSLAGNSTGTIAKDLPVFGSPIAADLRVEMLLGRDILDRCVLTYSGIDGRFTLAYNPP